MKKLNIVREKAKNGDTYVIAKGKKSGEGHLFFGNKVELESEKELTHSVCGKVKLNESKRVKTYPSGSDDENVVRSYCAYLGREFCGTCVSTLYKTELVSKEKY